MTENPYASPSSPTTSRRPGSSITSILLLIGMFPAAAVSCFAICYTGVQIAPTPRNYGDAMQNFFVSMAVGAVSGATIFGLMLWRAIAPRRKSHGPRIWTYEDGTKVDASLVQCGEAEVVLRKLDNVEVQVPITLLCEGDREWLKNKKRK